MRRRTTALLPDTCVYADHPLSRAGPGACAGGPLLCCLTLMCMLTIRSPVQDQARAQAMAERQKHKREAKEWLEDQVPRLAGK